MFRLVVLLLGSVVYMSVAGCGTHHKLHSGKAPVNELAYLYGIGGEDTLWGYTSIQIITVNGNVLHPGDMYPNSVEVVPGKYKVELGVYNVRSYQTTLFEWQAEKGRKYQIKFEPGEGHNNSDVLNIKKVWIEDALSGEFVQEISGWSEIKQRIYFMEIDSHRDLEFSATYWTDHLVKGDI